MNRTTSVFGFVAVLATGAACGLWFFGPDGTAIDAAVPGPVSETTTGGSLLQALRIAPDPQAGEVLQVKLYAPVEFIYELRNTGAAPLHGLSTKMCGCQVTQRPAQKLAPGGTTRLGLKIKASSYGRFETAVPIVADGYEEPLIVLRLAVQVPVDPPVLRQLPGPAQLTFIRGNEDRRILRVQTIERSGTQPWIEGAEISPSGFVAAVVEPVQERAYLDPGLCIRTYPISVVPMELPADRQHVMLRLKASSDAEAPDPIPLELRVDDRLVVVPNPIRLVFFQGHDPPKACIIAVDRQGSAVIEVVEHDHRLVDVRRVSDDNPRRVVFEIEPKVSPEQPVETTVVFEVDGRDRQRVKVRLGPASRED